jgi:hypothetical protein
MSYEELKETRAKCAAKETATVKKGVSVRNHKSPVAQTQVLDPKARATYIGKATAPRRAPVARTNAQH